MYSSKASYRNNEAEFLTCAFFVAVVMGMRIWIANGSNFFLQGFDFRPQGTNVAAKSYLLSGRQFGQARLDVIGNWLHHFSFLGCSIGGKGMSATTNARSPKIAPEAVGVNSKYEPTVSMYAYR